MCINEITKETAQVAQRGWKLRSGSPPHPTHPPSFSGLIRFLLSQPFLSSDVRSFTVVDSIIDRLHRRGRRRRHLPWFHR